MTEQRFCRALARLALLLLLAGLHAAPAAAQTCRPAAANAPPPAAEHVAPPAAAHAAGTAAEHVAPPAAAHPASTAAADPAKATVFIVVRHAEKSDDDARDPSLSEAGLRRAASLVRVLEGADIAAVYTTQYRRTRQTGQPAATRFGAPLLARPIDAEGAARHAAATVADASRLHAGRGVLIVGHSNTVPDILVALGVEGVAELGDDDYEDLFVVTVEAGTQPRVVRARY